MKMKFQKVLFSLSSFYALFLFNIFVSVVFSEKFNFTFTHICTHCRRKLGGCMLKYYICSFIQTFGMHVAVWIAAACLYRQIYIFIFTLTKLFRPFKLFSCISLGWHKVPSSTKKKNGNEKNKKTQEDKRENEFETKKAANKSECSHIRSPKTMNFYFITDSNPSDRCMYGLE